MSFKFKISSVSTSMEPFFNEISIVNLLGGKTYDLVCTEAFLKIQTVTWEMLGNFLQILSLDEKFIFPIFFTAQWP